MAETFEEKIQRVTAEVVELAPYNPLWQVRFQQEKEHLQKCLPLDLLSKIEHFGSTSIPEMPAKPIVDMVIEITDEKRAKKLVPEILEPQGYDCFWRPLGNENVPPYFTWCIKRNSLGERTHHLHFVVAGFKDSELLFRDILRSDPELARQYGALKQSLAETHHADRIKYTEAKGEFIRRVLASYRQGAV